MPTPRTTKLNMISGELLSKCRDGSSTGKSRSKDNKIKFLDEEYPDLGRKQKVPPQAQILHTEIRDDDGRLLTSAKESNSEWETEEEYKELSEDLEQLDLKAEQEEVKVEVVSDNKNNFSYSSILKSSKKPEEKIIKLPEPVLETPDCPPGSKKVKKKERKRGKEREGGKKKRKTLMKKIILADREKRREARLRTETEAEVVAKFIESSVEDKAKSNIHNRRFRTYCDHLLSTDLDNTVAALMSDLIRFKDKVHAKDPDKARAKRRYIVGLRECAKFLKVKKLSCIIFAPNIEKIEAEGGLDDTVSRLITEAAGLNVSVVFSLNRYKLGRLCYKKVAISCIGILNYQGSDVSKLL